MIGINDSVKYPKCFESLKNHFVIKLPEYAHRKFSGCLKPD